TASPISLKVGETPWRSAYAPMKSRICRCRSESTGPDPSSARRLSATRHHLYKETSFASHMLDSNLLEHKSEQQVKPASGMSVGDVQDQRLQELAGRGIGVVVPDHGHDLGWVEHGPAGLTHQADQAVLPDLHVGEFPVRPGTEPD